MANRDVKLENLLVDTHTAQRPLLKVCDLSYSKVGFCCGWAASWVRGAGGLHLLGFNLGCWPALPVLLQGGYQF